MTKPDFYYSDDYAGLTFDGGSFYYGYEHSKCLECGKILQEGSKYCDECEDAESEWCFEAKFDGSEITIPFSKLGAKDMFDVLDCLNIGIGWIFAQILTTIDDREET
jgi:hypothetical protein